MYSNYRELDSIYTYFPEKFWVGDWVLNTEENRQKAKQQKKEYLTYEQYYQHVAKVPKNGDASGFLNRLGIKN